MTAKDRMTFDEACRDIGVSEEELERLVAAGEIASIKEGDTLYFKKDVVRRFKETRVKEPTILLSDDEINLLDEDVEEIDLLADDSPVEGDTPETTRTVPGGKGAVPGGKGAVPGGKGAAKKGEEALVGAKDELDLGDDDLFDIEIRKESETAELTRPAGKKKEEVAAGAGDETILNLDSLLEEEAEGTTPIPSGDVRLAEAETAPPSLGDDTLLDTELLDLGEEGDTFEADTAEELTVEDITEQGTLLRGGGARVMQMKRKKSHALWTAGLAISSLLLLLPLGILTNMIFVSSAEGPGVTAAKESYGWISEYNVLDGVVEGIADMFRANK